MSTADEIKKLNELLRDRIVTLAGHMISVVLAHDLAVKSLDTSKVIKLNIFSYL